LIKLRGERKNKNKDDGSDHSRMEEEEPEWVKSVVNMMRQKRAAKAFKILSSEGIAPDCAETVEALQGLHALSSGRIADEIIRLIPEDTKDAKSIALDVCEKVFREDSKKKDKALDVTGAHAWLYECVSGPNCLFPKAVALVIQTLARGDVSDQVAVALTVGRFVPLLKAKRKRGQELAVRPVIISS
jgi:hypothetical protein